jgi:hypothetical protein
MFRTAFRTLTILLCLAVTGFFLCTKNPVLHNPIPNTGKTSNGYFYILSPAAGDSIAFNSTIEILWMASQKVDDAANVRLYLYSDTHQVCVISPSSLNTGAFTWSAPNSGAGTRYRIKICVLSDTQHFDFGDYFSFYSPYNGTITVTKPDSASRLVLDSSYTIQWSQTGFPGSSLKLLLYDDTVFVSKIIEGLMIAVHTYPWDPVSSTRGSGTKYRIKAMSDFDSSIYGYSPYFTIASQYWGGFTINSPSDTSVWSGGSSYKIQWDTAGHPGPSVALQLCSDSVFVSTIASPSPNTGSFSWSIPLTATSGTKYRIKIVSTGDASLFAFSKKFSIKGMDPDAYEPDNSRDSASVLTFGTAQKHTITLNDTDWIKFTADSGSRYIVSDSGYASFQTGIPLFYAKENTFTSYNITNGSGLLRWMWPCDKGGVYYARISALTNGTTGGYSFQISPFDPATLVTFLSPVPASVVTAGTSFSVTWVPDSVMLGNNVYLYLYKNNNQLLSITAASAPDNGSYTWAVPAGLATGSDYRIRIANAQNSQFYGFSKSFSLSGLAPDTFENDDLRDSASLISFGTAQQHSISLSDTDWIRLAVDSGSTYLFQDKGTGSFQTTVGLFHGADAGMSSLKTTDTSGFAQWLWVCDRPSPWYARVFASNSGGYGSYSFTMKKFDSLSSVTFASPTASSKWFGSVSYTIAWTPDTAILGPTVVLRLVKAGAPSSALNVTSAPNSGSYSWPVPSVITPGSDYRIRIANAGNSQLFGLSPQFSISDVMPDSFEIDDIRSQASTLALGAAQQHSMTYADTDWVRFAADSGSRYVIVAHGSAGFRISAAMYSNTNGTSEGTFTSGTNGIAQSLWACVKSGTCYSRIVSNSTGTTGRYSFKVQAFDSSTIVPFTSPAAGAMWSTDSVYTVQWTPDTVLFGKLIRLFVFDKADQLVSAITAASASNTGSFSWTVPTGFASGTNYRIKLVNDNNAQMFGYSPVFSMKGMTPDSYEPDNPRSMASELVFGTPQQHTITFNDTDWVRFSADSGSVYFIRDTGASLFRTSVSLFYGADVSATASNNSTASGTFAWAWSCLKTGAYNARVTSYTAGAAGAYSFSISKFDTLASITFTSPISTSEFAAGASNTISWVPDTGILGTSAYLYLYKANKQLASISTSYVPNSGTFSWSAPSGLVTGNDYRIKIVSYDNSLVYGYCAAFTINGMTPDSYEPDNIRSQASSLAPGAAQQHSITYADTDWVQFSADSGSLYIVQDNGVSSFNTYVYLYYGTDAAYTSQSSTVSGTMSWLWTCAKTGTYYARITSSSVSLYGSYSFRVSFFDPSKSITFINPTSATTWTAGEPDTIRWVPDSAILGTSVALSIFKGSQQLLAYNTYSSSPNSGAYALYLVPAGCITGNDYRIKIANYSNSQLCGFSPAFSINGVTPDSYEPDNSSGQAGSLTFGTARQHTLTFADTDWIRFTADSAATYTIAIIQAQHNATTVDLLHGSETSPASGNTSNFPGMYPQIWKWKSPSGGTWYARVEGSALTYGGAYTFRMSKFDSLNTVQFSNPTASSVFTAGQQLTAAWTPDSVFYGNQIDIYLCKGFSVLPIYIYSGASVNNNGTITLTLPAGLPTGSDYRIKMADYPNAQLPAYSPAFTINGDAVDSYEPDNVRGQASALTFGTSQQHTITYADTDWIRFAADSGSTYIIEDNGAFLFNTVIRLYYSTDANYTAQNNTSSGSGSLKWSWLCQKSGTYYALVYAYASGSHGSYSFRATRLDTLNGITFAYPTSGTTWTGGSTYTVSWTVPDTSIYGSWVNLYLTRTSGTVLWISPSGAQDNGSFSFQVPNGIASGSDYRIKIVNAAAGQFYAYSQAFTISGSSVSADSYEPDNDRSLASSAILGTAQQHTMTFQDTDWVKFSADSGAKYFIRVNCDSAFDTYVFLYFGTNATATDQSQTTARAMSWLWTCVKSGTYYVRIFPVYSALSTMTGPYSFSVTHFDSIATFKFTYPTSGTTLSKGTAFTATWTPDTTLQGTFVIGYLYKGDSLVTSFSPLPNNGSYNFYSVPSVTGTNFRVKMERFQNNQVYGYSPYFTFN